MIALPLHESHRALGAHFVDLDGLETVAHYGDALHEHASLLGSAGVLDLSFRGRLCLTGTDRKRFLNGQVTNNVGDLKTGEGCYAALVTAKGKMVSDLNVYVLENEILLEFEPGMTERVAQRLETYIIADDVQIADVSPLYGLLSVQGPKAESVIRALELGVEPPTKPMHLASRQDATWGEFYLMNQPRLGTKGFDLFVPASAMGAMVGKAIAAAQAVGGGPCGWEACEIARIEAGIPRFGLDMDESNLPPEAGLGARAISYTKGCYIGQEVIARIRTYGQVAKSLRGLRLAGALKSLPAKGDKLFKDGKEVGFVTSAVASPILKAKIALGYVRREANAPGTELILRTAEGEGVAAVVEELPFR